MISRRPRVYVCVFGRESHECHDQNRHVPSRASEIPKSRFGILDEHTQDGSSSSLRVVEVGPLHRQLAGFRARPAAEPRVVFVHAVLGRHDELAFGEKRVVLTMGMNVDTWNKRGQIKEIGTCKFRALFSFGNKKRRISVKKLKIYLHYNCLDLC